MSTKAHRYSQRGVTLIELLVVVVVVAILGSIAVSSYRNQAMRANRSEAKTALLNLQAAQERYYLNANQYADLATLGVSETTPGGLYDIDLDVDPDGQGYLAEATPLGGQVGDAECPSFSIDQTGQRLPDPGMSNCWK